MFEEGASQNDNTCGPISDFIIVTFGEFNHKFGDWVLDFHLFEDGGSIVGDGDLLVRGDQEFIKTLGAE